MTVLFLIIVILFNNVIIDAFQLNNRINTNVRITNKIRTIVYDNNNNDKEYNKDYYMGMINNNDTEGSNKKDNLTPNIKLGLIFTGILFALTGAFLFANKDVQLP